MKWLWGWVPLLLLAMLAFGRPGVFDAPREPTFDYIWFEEYPYEYVCGESLDIRVFYFGPHITSCWVWFEYGEGLHVNFDCIVPGSGWHTDWNDEWTVTITYIGPGPGAWCDRRQIWWLSDPYYGCDGDKPIFVLEGIYADSCYTGDIVAVVEERENVYGQTFHDILEFGYVVGYMPSPVMTETWSSIKAMYR